jgi:hypothetical protein
LKMHSEITDVIYELQEENDENEKKISKWLVNYNFYIVFLLFWQYWGLNSCLLGLLGSHLWHSASSISV